MHITNLRVCQPHSPGVPHDWRESMGQILVAIDTDAGLTGYGVGGGGLAGMHVVRTVLRDLLIGLDPGPVEELWNSMYRATIMFGRKGLAVMALSGVDLALWDLRGKAEGVSVTELLGAQPGGELPVYSTFWGKLQPEQIEPYSAVKLHLGKSTGNSQQMIDAIHKARDIAENRKLMLDAWMQWDCDTTLEIAQAVADCQIDWIEEPILIEDVAGYQKLCVESPIPIAGGEHEFTRYGFAELIDKRLHHVLQPDVCWCGGMTTLVEIYRMANAAGIRVVPHRGAELWALPALAALDPNPLAESGRPWMTWVGNQPDWSQGTVRVPKGPGFGVETDEGMFE